MNKQPAAEVPSDLEPLLALDLPPSKNVKADLWFYGIIVL